MVNCRVHQIPRSKMHRQRGLQINVFSSQLKQSFLLYIELGIGCDDANNVLPCSRIISQVRFFPRFNLTHRFVMEFY